jgi:ferredoxin/flavodoxin---NADP+ reductase
VNLSTPRPPTAATGAVDGLAVLPGQRLYVIGSGMPRARLERLARRAAASGDFEQILLVHDCLERVDLGCEDCPLGARADLPSDGPGPVCMRQYRAAQADAAGLAPVADLLTSGRLGTELGTPSLDPRRDRVLVCATRRVASQVREILSVWGFTQTERGVPGQFAVDCGG